MTGVEPTPAWTATAQRWRVRVVVALGSLALCYAVSTLPGVRTSDGAHPALDGWLVGIVGLLAVVAAATRPMRSAEERLLWTVVAVVVLMRAAILLLDGLRPPGSEPPTSVSARSVLWLGSTVVLLTALVRRLRVLLPTVTLAGRLDALVGATTTAALYAALLSGVVSTLTADEPAAARTAFIVALAAADAAVVMTVLALIVANQWEPQLGKGVLAVASVAAALAHGFYLFELSVGTYSTGEWLGAVQLFTVVGMASAGWLQPPGPPRGPVTGPPNFAPPVFFAVLSIGLLVYASYATVPVAARMLAATALGVVLVRVLWSQLRDREVAARERSAAAAEVQRFQTLVENSGDFVAVGDLDGHVLYVNPAGRELVGLPPDADVRSTKIPDYLTPEGWQSFLAVEHKAVLADGHWEGEATLRDMRGGPPVPVAVSTFMVKSPETGEPVALATVQRDMRLQIRAARELKRLAEERQMLLDRLVDAQETERQRIASDVHDDTVQILAALELRLSVLRDRTLSAAPQLLPLAEQSLETVREATVRLRELLFDLESPAQDAELATVVHSAAEHVFAGTDTEVRFRGDHSVDLPEAARITAYRIVKEALVNARKHARADEVVISLRRDEGWVEIEVEDDGVGIDPGGLRRRHGHLGLASMSDRATIAGGRLDVCQPEAGGTRVVLRMPVRTGAQAVSWPG